MSDYECEGQLGLFDPSQVSIGGCGNEKNGCICVGCLNHWKGSCPYGECYDDKRAKDNPFIKAHNGKVRDTWSEWSKPGEQNHWCRGGAFYAALICEKYIPYKGQVIKECLKANVSVFQDGYIRCSLVENYGCDKCYEEFEEAHKEST